MNATPKRVVAWQICVARPHIMNKLKYNMGRSRIDFAEALALELEVNNSMDFKPIQLVIIASDIFSFLVASLNAEVVFNLEVTRAARFALIAELTQRNIFEGMK